MWMLAWRNLWRNKGRTLIMLSAIAFSYGMLLFGMGVADYMHGRMLRSAARAAGGDVLVHADGYWDSRASKRMLRDSQGAIKKINAIEGVRATIPRVIVDGLLSTATTQTPVHLVAVDPKVEAALDDPREKITEGDFVGADLEARGHPIVLGAALAEELAAKRGDKIVLTATDGQGELTRALFFLSGIIKTGSGEMERSMAYTTLEAGQTVMGVPGAITQLGVVSGSKAGALVLDEKITAALQDAEQPRVEVLSWQEALPEMVGFIEIDDAFLYIMGLGLFFIVAFAITNTFMMVVMERVREFGLLSALGMRQRRLGSLLMSETFMLATVGVTLGLIIGLSCHGLINYFEPDMSVFMSEADQLDISGIAMETQMRSELRPVKWIGSALFVLLFVVASAIYPAIRATRLSPAQAMRFFG